jgi:hypothetical protein
MSSRSQPSINASGLSAAFSLPPSLAVPAEGCGPSGGGSGGGGGGGGASPLTEKQRAKQQLDGRKEMLRRFWHGNKDQVWAIEPSLRGQPLNDSVKHLMRVCDERYGGDFATMLRNLEHDARELRLRSSVGAQQVLRPAVTARVKDSEAFDGYATARRKQEERLERVYADKRLATERRGLEWAEGGGAGTSRSERMLGTGRSAASSIPERGTPEWSSYVFNRTKGLEPEYGNCANWCAARIRHGPVGR